MKLVSLKVENFKIIELVELELDGKGGVVIKAKNKRGKSTIIDSILVALTGKEVPGRPIRDGATSGVIEAKIDDDFGGMLTVQKKFTASGASLIVKSPDGQKYKSPQKLLDKVVGKVSFDPFDFVRKRPLEQKRELMEILGLDLEPFEDEKRIYLNEVKDFRYEVERLTRNLKQFSDFEGELVEHSGEDIEKRRLDNVAKADKIGETHSKINALKQQEKEYESSSLKHSNSIESNSRKIEEFYLNIKNIEKENELLEDKIQVESRNVLDIREQLSKNSRELAELPIPEDVDFTKELEEISKHNDAVNNERRRLELVETIEDLEKKKSHAFLKSEAVEVKRSEKIASVKMPAEGLTFSDDGLLFEGFPFTEEQVNTATIIRVGVGIQISINPNLRILRLKNWSLLDGEAREAVVKLAEEHDFQVFAEEVTNGDELGFEIIEKGES